jgi:[protein-PII] uridylyltransferase
MSSTSSRRFPQRPLDALIDRAALDAALDAVAERHTGDGDARHRAVVQLLKDTLAEGRDRAEAWLAEDGGGTLCARRLSHLMDELLRALLRFVKTHIYPCINPSEAEKLAIGAVGGYGRGTLAPGSDIDLLFLLPYKQTAWGESVIEAMLYVLWDLGLKVGHATRSIDECIRLARADMTIRTAVLEIRPLAGDTGLIENLMERFDREIVQGTSAEFVAAKLAERDARHRRGGPRYVVEPNVKEGKGGLRDLHTLFWIAKYVYRVREVDELVKAGLFTRQELRLFNKAEDFLWAVRCHLHFLTGRAEERLSFDVQREVAVRLGYQEHPGLQDVERFMKHYFLVAKDVGDLTAIVCAALEARHEKSRPTLNRFLRPFARKRTVMLKEAPDFIIENDRLGVRDDEAFARDPVNLIRFFHVASRRGLAMHPDAMRLVTRSLGLIDASLRENPDANRLFLEILTAHDGVEVVLRRMNEAGVLGRFVPDFGRVVAMMQFNMYHHYTVDEHLIRSVGVLAEMDAGRLKDEHPLSNELLPEITNKRALYVAIFLHDIAKGRPEDHSTAGAKIARRLCPRFGLSAAETATVAWLVEQHLTMSITAQSRDLSDRRTIEDFAKVVQSLERLKMLLVLTVADIKAVGPGVWNGWKGQLLRTLYWETEIELAGGHSTMKRSQRVAQAQEDLRRALTDWTDDQVERYLTRHYPPYWLRVDLDRRVSHARFIRRAQDEGRKIATAFSSDVFRGVTEITVLAPDHPWVLSSIAGACAAAGANIMDAYIHTTTDGLALDTIFINRAFEADADEERRAIRIGDMIEAALTGTLKLSEAVQRKSEQKSRRSRAFTVEPEVLVTNTWSDRYTVIEVSGLDRPGLLFELTAVVSRLNLNIGSAHVATFGERAVDVFYVTDLTGEKVISASRQAAIQRQLRAVFGVDDEASKPLRKTAPSPGRTGKS